MSTVCIHCLRDMRWTVSAPSILKIRTGCTECGDANISAYEFKEVEKQQSGWLR